MPALLLILASVIGPGPRAHAMLYDFKPEPCYQLLAAPPEIDAGARAVAEEMFSWTTMRHPFVRLLLERTRDLDVAFDLLFLSTGHHFPPHGSMFESGNQALRRWRMRMSVKKALKLAIPCYRLGTPLPPTELPFDGLSESERRRLEILCTIGEDSVWALKGVASPENHAMGKDVEFPHVEFTSYLQSLGQKGTATVRGTWPLSFSRGELAHFHDLRRKFMRPAPMAHYLRLLDHNLGALALEQATMCARLKSCFQVGDFNSVYRDVKSSPAPTVKSIAFARTTKLAQTHAPVKYAREEMLAFLASRSSAESPQFEAEDLFALLDDLNRTATLLGRALVDLEKWRADEFEWAGWREALVPTMEALDRFQFELGFRAREIAGAKAKYAEAESDFANLALHLERVRAQVEALDLDEGRVAQLRDDDKLVLKSILGLLPGVEELVRWARGSVATRQTIMTEQFVVMSTVLVALADLIGERVGEPKTTEPLDDSPRYREIRDVVAEMAGEGEQSRD